jgi:hypothetical protein
MLGHMNVKYVLDTLFLLLLISVHELCRAQVTAEHAVLTGIKRTAPKQNFLHYPSNKCQNTGTVLY